jgi:oligoribonuclease
MAEKSELIPTHFFWLDLEFTGFDPVHDPILEVYMAVTDVDKLEVIEDYWAIIKHNPTTVATRMNGDFWQQFPELRKDFLDRCSAGTALEAVEASLVSLVNSYVQDGMSAFLAGNSIHMDRRMIDVQMPVLSKRLHYRMLDVTSLKLMALTQGFTYQKNNSHHAKQDVLESIAEYKYYKQYFSVK